MELNGRKRNLEVKLVNQSLGKKEMSENFEMHLRFYKFCHDGRIYIFKFKKKLKSRMRRSKSMILIWRIWTWLFSILFLCWNVLFDV